MVWYFIVVILFAILAFLVYSAVKEDKVKCEEYKTKCKEINEESSEVKKELTDEFQYLINSNLYTIKKVLNLPTNFRIGNVFFTVMYHDACEQKQGELQNLFKDTDRYYFYILSHVEINGKVYDNGNICVDYFNSEVFKTSSFKTTNEDLWNYIVNNLDKVEDVKD